MGVGLNQRPKSMIVNGCQLKLHYRITWTAFTTFMLTPLKSESLGLEAQGSVLFKHPPRYQGLERWEKWSRLMDIVSVLKDEKFVKICLTTI